MENLLQLLCEAKRKLLQRCTVLFESCICCVLCGGGLATVTRTPLYAQLEAIVRHCSRLSGLEANFHSNCHWDPPIHHHRHQTASGSSSHHHHHCHPRRRRCICITIAVIRTMATTKTALVNYKNKDLRTIEVAIPKIQNETTWHTYNIQDGRGCS